MKEQTKIKMPMMDSSVPNVHQFVNLFFLFKFILINQIECERRSRLSSSNESSHLDDLSDVGFSSPVSCFRQRARSLR